MHYALHLVHNMHYACKNKVFMHYAYNTENTSSRKAEEEKNSMHHVNKSHLIKCIDFLQNINAMQKMK